MPPLTNIDPGPNTIRILLTTDNHVGYKENDPIIGDDSWKTFNEITEIAKDKDVDMILQGGDLFHINKPSKKSMFHVMKSLRLNCMGDRPCELELLSDPSISLSNGFDMVNYEDPNINVSIPVFAISGNHDDATGVDLLSPLDLLSISGLINHFGKIPNNEDITVSPLLFQKGTTKFALYGIANVRDERLHRAFRDGLVKFLRPSVQTDEWFNLLCFHQNHAEHSRTSHIPEHFLPRFLNFILWGHEHECIPNPVFNPETGFDVLQAGSSIATSLSEGEVTDKNVFIMNIKGTEYSIEPIKLKTVRPFVMEEVMMSKTNLMPGEASKADVIDFLTREVERLIEEANNKFKESNTDLFTETDDLELQKNTIPLPLIRLRVEYSGGYELENARRFSNRFVERIANVNDVVQFYQRKVREKDHIIKKAKFTETDLFEENSKNKKDLEVKLQDLIEDFLSQTELTLIPEQGIIHAVDKFVENDDKHVLDNYIKNEIEKETKMLLELDINDDEFHDQGEQHAKKVFKHILTQFKSEDSGNCEKRINHSDSVVSTNIVLKESKKKKKSLKGDSFVVSGTESETMLDVHDIVGQYARPIRSSRTRKKLQEQIPISDNNDEDDESYDVKNLYEDNVAAIIVDSDEDEELTRKTSRTRRRKDNIKLNESSNPKPTTKGATTKGNSSSRSRKTAKPKQRATGQGSLFDSIMSMGGN